MTEAATSKKAKKEVVRTPVTLTTGEIVEFTERQRTVKSSTLENGRARVRFAFRNGEVREYSFDKHTPLLMRLAIHGALQKIGDETAVVLSPEAMDELHAQLGDSVWVQKPAAASNDPDEISDEEFERQMAVARDAMKKYERALRELAK